MKLKQPTNHAFTLIELLTVIAVIAILGSILIPVTGGVMKQARISASKAQLSQYVTAIENFKAEYNYFPTIFNGERNYNLGASWRSRQFMETLSGRDAFSGRSKQVGGNRYGIQFHSFSTIENFDNNGSIQRQRLADRFNNTLIFFRVDGNGDGFLRPSVPAGRAPESPSSQFRANATAWVLEPTDGSTPGYALWE